MVEYAIITVVPTGFVSGSGVMEWQRIAFEFDSLPVAMANVARLLYYEARFVTVCHVEDLLLLWDSHSAGVTCFQLGPLSGVDDDDE